VGSTAGPSKPLNHPDPGHFGVEHPASATTLPVPLARRCRHYVLPSPHKITPVARYNNEGDGYKELQANVPILGAMTTALTTETAHTRGPATIFEPFR